MNKNILWIRELTCGHERPTNIAFICGVNIKPKVGDNCYCRECNMNVTITKVKESSKKARISLEKLKEKTKQEEDEK